MLFIYIVLYFYTIVFNPCVKIISIFHPNSFNFSLLTPLRISNAHDNSAIPLVNHSILGNLNLQWCKSSSFGFFVDIIATLLFIYCYIIQSTYIFIIIHIIDNIVTIYMEDSIVFVSGHYPKDTYYASKTKKSIEKYVEKHGYHFYYSDEDPDDTAQNVLHFYRCSIIKKASIQYPDAKWFIWLDSDVYVNNYDMKVEDQLNLLDSNILYHLFHERDWGCYPINTGVKFVNRDALEYEDIVWSLRNTHPWNTFPWEQKTIYEYVLPQIPGRYIIHDPYILNCIIKAYPDKVKDALFVHMCGTPVEERNSIAENIII
jgi:hypothetical protein